MAFVYYFVTLNYVNKKLLYITCKFMSFSIQLAQFFLSMHFVNGVKIITVLLEISSWLTIILLYSVMVTFFTSIYKKKKLKLNAYLIQIAHQSIWLTMIYN